MAHETIRYALHEGIGRITLHRPDKLNAFNTLMHTELRAALEEAPAAGARVLIVSGAGRAFCAGQDLGDRAVAPGGAEIDLGASIDAYYKPLVLALRQLPLPIIAAVNGVAAGAGLSLALSADLVVAKESASFLLAFVNIGLVPDAGSSLFVPARVGFTRAAEMAMLGEPVRAPKAADIGLINASWPDDEFEKNAQALLLRLSNGPTRSYAGTKRELNHWVYAGMAEHLALEASIQGGLASGSKDVAEGIAAFIEKRPSQFTGQ